jgi:transposase
VQRRPGRRNLARFEDLPVTTHGYELSAAQRACAGCGQERKEIGAEESWQVEYVPGHVERRQHIRKKYACPHCESQGESPQITVAVKPETAIDKGRAGPGLLAYIVTSKFSDYLPRYRLEDIFERQGFEISRATQSVWCGDVADLAEPLYGWQTAYEPRLWWPPMTPSSRCCGKANPRRPACGSMWAMPRSPTTCLILRWIAAAMVRCVFSPEYDQVLVADA